MKKIVIILALVFWVVTLKINIQAQSVFGWSQYNFPTLPSNDLITLSASTETHSYPEITGYNNENSLEINIQRNTTGWSCITKTFSPPLTMGINTPNPQLNCNFVVKTNDNFQLTTLIKYNNEWYFAGIIGRTFLGNNWYIINNQNWHNINGSGQLLTADSVTIDTAIIYFHSYGQGATLILDTWFNSIYNPIPMVFDGFGDILSTLETINNIYPNNFSLAQNYPNPFNSSTKIQFTIPTTFVDLSIYNVLGQKISTLISQELSAGTFEYNFAATTLPSGIYFYSLKTENFVISKKMTLLK